MISAIILAAGCSTRMGRQKLLLPLDNDLVVEKTIKIIESTKAFEEVILVYSDERVLKVCSGYFTHTAKNPNPENGLSSSIKIGINAANEHAKAFMFFMGDQPFIDVELIKKLLDEYNKREKSILIPVYNGKRGMPSIFSAKWKNDFMKIEGDVGGRVIIKENSDQAAFVNIADDLMGLDLDTEEAYAKALDIVKIKYGKSY